MGKFRVCVGDPRYSAVISFYRHTEEGTADHDTFRVITGDMGELKTPQISPMA